jgi:hypothetical protein
VLVPIVLGLLVAAGIGTARQGSHSVANGKPKPRHSPDPPQAVKHDESPPIHYLRSKPPKGRNDHQERKIPVPLGSTGADPVRQSSPVQTSSPTPGSSFNGISAVDSLPPDPNGAVGPNNYVQIVNESFAVYSKTGVKQYGPVTTNTLFTGFGGDCETYNDGDATVVYDRAADRWVISQFAVSGSNYYQCVAVSTTADPTGSYYRYAFQYDSFPDYPKLGVWPDAYYETFNLFDFSFIGPEVCAYDRASMLSGLPATQQCFILDAQYGGMLPSDVDSATPPPTGAPNYLLNFNTNSLDLWKFHVDWTTPANTTLTGPTAISVANFAPACGGGACIQQPQSSPYVGTLDSLGDRLMYRLAYRNFGDHESLVVNHSINAGNRVGIRWYELRNTPASALGTPSVFQQGTYAPDSTEYRWMGSIAMSGTGDIALGYSRSSAASGDYPSVAYTGRLAGDAPGVMTQGETVLKAGQGSQEFYDRWGDYSSMSVDPTDDCTFWYTGEYLPSTDSFNWSTRIGSFKLPGCGGAVSNDFSLAANPTAVSVQQGQSGGATINTAVTTGSAQTVSLSASGQPSGTTVSFNPSSVTAGGSSTMTINVGSSTAPGSYTITVTGTGTSATHTATVSLTVTASSSSDFSIAANPTSLIIKRSKTATSTISTAVVGGSAQKVSLSASGQPNKVTVSFSSTSVTAGGSSKMTVKVNSGAATGSGFAIKVTGKSATATHTVTVSLQIK